MLIKCALATLAVAACLDNAQPPPSSVATSEVSDPIIDTCNPVNFPCNPSDPWADRWCQLICDLDGTEGYCLPYSAVADRYCATHPDKMFGPYQLCSLSGSPTWDTHCEPGWLP